MHHKYVVRDAALPSAAVWTGSTNWTADSWTREENLIVAVDSHELAGDYLQDFEALWSDGSVQASGHFDPGWREIVVEGRKAQARAVFSPGRGRRMSHLVADRLGQAQRRIRISSPVLTSGPILASLAELPEGLDCRIVYDRTQMQEVLAQWSADPHSAWKAPIFTTAIGRLAHASKVTTPYAPGSVHDYMHAKIVVADDTALVGSYNLSRSGEMNAENVLEIRDPGLAGQLAGFVDRIFAKYH
jgi:phosphatidylserine/phosphatidylglycerophosphate/cardiolipin synthase-like enzyme